MALLAFGSACAPADAERAPPPSRTEASSSPAEEHFAFIRAVKQTDGRWYVVADYASLLTGAEANRAARADGFIAPGEDELPQGYYIRNVNPRVRELPLAAGAPIHLLRALDGTAPDDAAGGWPTARLSPAQLRAYTAGDARGLPPLWVQRLNRDGTGLDTMEYPGGRWVGIPCDILVRGGVVEEITEVYFP